MTPSKLTGCQDKVTCSNILNYEFIPINIFKFGGTNYLK